MTRLLDWSFRHPRIVDGHGRCACVLVVDTSASMEGDKMKELNAALLAFQGALRKDDKTRSGVDVALVAFGAGVDVVRQFGSAGSFDPPVLEAVGAETLIAAGLEQGLSLLDAQRQLYEKQGIAAYRPWMLLLTDGAPSDSASDIAAVSAQISRAHASGRLAFWVVGVPGASFDELSAFAPDRRTFALNVGKLSELMLWLTESMTRVSIVRDQSRTDIPIQIATNRFERGA